MTEPVLFAFGVHLHQPVGNLEKVFVEHLDSVYRPLIRQLREAESLPVTLHLSGPLLEWMESNATDYLDEIGSLAANGRLELLLSGYDEPILASLPREDRLEQISRMREAIQRRFGVAATGLWLTERVWEPDLAADLAAAGVRYVLVDDRHFLVTGLDRAQLHRPFRTEADEQPIAVFPIDERLRYLIPFRPPSEFAEYIRTLQAEGHRLAVFADDGEKFGGWPGTYDWVYTRGWLRQFLETIAQLAAEGALRLTTFGEALDTVPSGGLAYLPSASYREMEGWALPADASVRLTRLEQELGDRMQGPEGVLVRGTHWRNFLVKYPESNRMHKKMLRLSRLCRERGDPEAVRRSIGRAQCNDAYWHGVFGGLYLPFLRGSVWHHLATAERDLRHGEPMQWERRDLDFDGHDELSIHSPAFAAVVSGARGGGVEEYTRFDTLVNYASVLTRRREAYHEAAAGSPETRDIPVDRVPRAMFLERILPGDLTLEAYTTGDYPVLTSWASAPLELQASGIGPASVVVRLTTEGFEKRYRFAADGTIDVEFRWAVAPELETGWFTTELSVSEPLEIEPESGERWTHPVETVAKSERGFDRSIQGRSVTFRWPATAGRARLRVRGPASAPSE
jgi:alpha-amylase/alpha-mannosidase (GH57 family)